MMGCGQQRQAVQEGLVSSSDPNNISVHSTQPDLTRLRATCLDLSRLDTTSFCFLFPSMMCDRRQHQELRRRQSQIRLLCPRSLRAVAAGRRHYQDSLQEGPQWMVERRSLRPGKDRLADEQIKYQHVRLLLGLSSCELLLFPGGLFPSKLCGRGQLRVLLMHLLRCVHPVFVHIHCTVLWVEWIALLFLSVYERR